MIKLDSKIKFINIIVSTVIWVLLVGMVFSKIDGITGAILFLVFISYPHLINNIIILKVMRNACQWILLLTQIAYFSWFTYIFIDVFYLHPDPNGSIAFIFVGIYAMAVLIPAWIVCAIINSNHADGLKNENL